MPQARHHGRATIALLVLAMILLAACGSTGSPASSATGATTVVGPSTSATSPQSKKPPATRLQAALLTSLQQIESEAARAQTTLGKMQADNDAGVTYPASGVTAVTSQLVELLTATNAELRAALPTLPANTTASANALATALQSSIAAFGNTKSLAGVTGSSGSAVLGSGAAGALGSVVGGALIDPYLNDVGGVTSLAHGAGHTFVTELEANIDAAS